MLETSPLGRDVNNYRHRAMWAINNYKFTLYTSFNRQFHQYFKTVREREMRIKGGKNEQHKEKCKKNRRLQTVSFDKYSITIQFV